MKSNKSKALFYGATTMAAMCWLINMLAKSVQGDYESALLSLTLVIITMAVMILKYIVDWQDSMLDVKDQLIDELMDERREKNGK